MGGFTGVVFQQAPFQINGYTHISLGWRFNALNQINVMHGEPFFANLPSPAEAGFAKAGDSKGILLRVR